MSKNDWTNKLRDRLADHQESASHDLWAGIESSLAHKDNLEAETEIKTASKARIVNVKRWTAYAAAVALLGVGGSYVYLHQDSEQETKGKHVVAMAENTENAKNNLAAKTYIVSDRSSLLAADSKSTGLAGHHETAGFGLSYEETSACSDEEASARSKALTEASISDENSALSNEVALAVAAPSAGKNEKVSPSRNQEASSPFDSYDFSSATSHSLAWSMNLYAENVTINSQEGGANRTYVASDPMSGGGFNDGGVMVEPGTFADKATFLAAASPWLRSARYQKAKHHAPLAVGMQVGIGVLPRLTLSTGVVYTRTSSDFQPVGVDDFTVHQVLHYVGVPFGVNYQVWSKSGFSAYVMAGGEVDFNVKNDTEDSGHKEDVKRDRPQFSAKTSLGLQYDFTPQVGLYLEPGAKYYFDNGSEIENTFKDKKLNFNFQFGLRWNIVK